MKVIQILNGQANWITSYKSLSDTFGRFHPSIIFVEAPDEVEEGWIWDEENKVFIPPVIEEVGEDDENSDSLQ